MDLKEMVEIIMRSLPPSELTKRVKRLLIRAVDEAKEMGEKGGIDSPWGVFFKSMAMEAKVDVLTLLQAPDENFLMVSLLDTLPGTPDIVERMGLGNYLRATRMVLHTLEDILSGNEETNLPVLQFIAAKREYRNLARLGQNPSQLLEKIRLMQDQAMITNKETLGGIDLDPASLLMDIQRDGQGIVLPGLEQLTENLNIKGLIPVIINVVPVADVKTHLGAAVAK